MTTQLTATVRIVLIDDHTLVRQSIARMIGQHPGMDVVADAGTPDEGLIAVQQHRPDLVVLDVGLPRRSGLDVAAAIKQMRPQTKIVFLTMHEDDATVARAIGLGADGYLLKTASTEELLMGVAAVAAGQSYLSPAIARRVMNRAIARPVVELTDRELEILRLVARGERPSTVARELCVSLRTIRNHLANVYAKLGVSSAAQAVAEAYKRGLVAGDR